MNRAAQFKKVTHVIFDLDGVILDTERLYTVGIQNVVSKFGKTFDWTIKPHLMGLTGKEASEKIVQLLELPISPEEFYALAQAQYAIVMQETQIMPDTEIIYKAAIANIAKRFGKVYTPEIRNKVLGTLEKESARIAVTEMKIPMPVDIFQTEFSTTAHNQFHNVSLMPGADRLVRHLHKNKIPIAIATSSTQDSFNLKAKVHKDFFSKFSHVVCGGSDPDVKEGKPKPDIFLVCASRFPDKPHPEKCLVFEDAPNGVTAAVTAGMQVVMVPDENLPENLRGGATIVLNPIDATPLERFGLPALSS